jgi:hypothetical protein
VDDSGQWFGIPGLGWGSDLRPQALQLFCASRGTCNGRGLCWRIPTGHVSVSLSSLPLTLVLLSLLPTQCSPGHSCHFYSRGSTAGSHCPTTATMSLLFPVTSSAVLLMTRMQSRQKHLREVFIGLIPATLGGSTGESPNC